MKPIGGFFDIEIKCNERSLHPAAAALSTGRACMALWIKEVRPTRIYVPYYCCDALFHPIEQASIPIVFYGINEHLNPVGLPEFPKVGDWLVWTNYFGILSQRADSLLHSWENRVLIDNTHAFFEPDVSKFWSFTSARKYFGVPDGAYLFSPLGKSDISNFKRFVPDDVSHLVSRYTDNVSRALSLYRKAESRFDSSINRISIFSEKLLSSIDLKEIKNIRSRNLQILNHELGEYNNFALSNEITKHSAFCYPFLPKIKICRENLAKEKIYVPTLWLDTLDRNLPGFDLEKTLSKDLLPLPVDHRYDESDMLRIANVIKKGLV